MFSQAVLKCKLFYWKSTFEGRKCVLVVRVLNDWLKSIKCWTYWYSFCNLISHIWTPLVYGSTKIISLLFKDATIISYFICKDKNIIIPFQPYYLAYILKSRYWFNSKKGRPMFTIRSLLSKYSSLLLQTD